jgi:hypothetical protein
MACLFTEIYWIVDEVIVESYWRVLYSDFEEVQEILFLQNVFTLNIFQILKVELFIFC